MTGDEVFGIEVDGGRIAVSGDLDAHTAPQLDGAVDRLLAAGTDPIVLQMGAVGFVDSSGLRCMIRARHEGDGERTVIVEDPSAATLRLLEITGMSDEFTIRRSS